MWIERLTPLECSKIKNLSYPLIALYIFLLLFFSIPIWFFNEMHSLSILPWQFMAAWSSLGYLYLIIFGFFLSPFLIKLLLPLVMAIILWPFLFLILNSDFLDSYVFIILSSFYLIIVFAVGFHIYSVSFV